MVWGGVATVAFVALFAAATSPLLQWREPIYIVAGLAGVVAMVVLPLQPLAAAQRLAGLSQAAARRLHRWVGATICVAVVVHVGGLWITSPPDVIDALTFTSPTPFSAWGVIAMWAVFVSAALAILRLQRRLRWRRWQRLHVPLAIVIVVGTILHALLIDGTMGEISKWVLSVLLLMSTGTVLWSLKRGR